MSTKRLILIAALASPLALASAAALTQDYPNENTAAAQVEDANPDAGAPTLAVTLGSDSDALAMADADVDHSIDLRVGDGSLTGQEADTVRADLDAIRADAAEQMNDNGGLLTGAQRDSLENRLTDLKDEVDDLANNPDEVPN